MLKRPLVVRELISNQDKVHEDHLLELLNEAQEFTCLVAYATISGFKKLKHKLDARLQIWSDKGLKGLKKAQFFIGLDYCRTDPEVLLELLKLSTTYDGRVELYISAAPPGTYYHPKAYIFKRRDGVVKALVGSANLTGGGLSSNHELSILTATDNAGFLAPIKELLNTLLDDSGGNPYMVSANKELIQAYRRRCEIYRINEFLVRRKTERIFKALTARSKLQIENPSIEILQTILEEMRLDTSDQGWEKATAARHSNRPEARKCLDAIRKASISLLSEEKFLELYHPLSHGIYWHSRGLERGIGRIKNSAIEFKKALKRFDLQYCKYGATIAPESAFEILLEDFLSIKGAGVNVITEILHTYDNEKFAVMNQNSVNGLALAGISGFPSSPGKTSVSSNKYAKFCEAADVVRKALGLKDFTELDAVFNYAYWRSDENKNEDEDEDEEEDEE